MLYGEVVLVAYLLSLLGYANVRVEHVRRRGRFRHDGLAEYVVEADLQLVHMQYLRRTHGARVRIALLEFPLKMSPKFERIRAGVLWCLRSAA